MKFASYFAVSLLAILAVVSYAIHTREQFYPTILFLVTSKVSFIVCGNMAIATAVLIGRSFKSIFLGTLREAEIEMLVENAKYAITETCLALTIFRSELSPVVLGAFGLLLFLKAFHWLARTRFDYIEQVLPNSYWMYVRLISLIVGLILADAFAAYFSINYTIVNGKSVVILFGFEFGLLIISILNLLFRYILFTIDTRLANGMQSKGFYIMILDLVCDGIRFATYVFFFGLVFVYYGMPIYIIREVWMAFHNFAKKFSSFVKYLKLSHNIGERFDDASVDEIAAAGDCLICREPMLTGKKLPCSHVFHLDCLKSWLQHQQSCPLCRADIPVDFKKESSRTRVSPSPRHATRGASTPSISTQTNNSQNNTTINNSTNNNNNNNMNMNMNHENQSSANIQSTQQHHDDSIRSNNNSAIVPPLSHPSDSNSYSQINNNHSNHDTSHSQHHHHQHTHTHNHCQEPTFPALFIVRNTSGVAVRAMPSYTCQTIMRHLERGVVVFASSLVRDDMKVPWIRITDGFVPLLHYTSTLLDIPNVSYETTRESPCWLVIPLEENVLNEHITSLESELFGDVNVDDLLPKPAGMHQQLNSLPTSFSSNIDTEHLAQQDEVLKSLVASNNLLVKQNMEIRALLESQQVLLNQILREKIGRSGSEAETMEWTQTSPEKSKSEQSLQIQTAESPMSTPIVSRQNSDDQAGTPSSTTSLREMRAKYFAQSQQS